MVKKPLPEFKDEGEEARWWYEHRDELDEYMEPLPDNPTPLHVRLGLPARIEECLPSPELTKKTASQPVSIRMLPDDVARAKKLALKKGIGYQTLLKMLIHEGLEKMDSEAS